MENKLRTVMVELTDAQVKALEHDCISIQTLFSERANVAVRDMAHKEIQRRLNNNEGVPAGVTVEDLVLTSPMLSAVERQRLAEEEMQKAMKGQTQCTT